MFFAQFTGDADHRRPGVNSIRIRPPRPCGNLGAAKRDCVREALRPELPAMAAFAGDAGIGRAMLTARRAKGGEAAVIGVGVLDALAVGDRAAARRGWDGEDS